jgi:hypothetical protein
MDQVELHKMIEDAKKQAEEVGLPKPRQDQAPEEEITSEASALADLIDQTAQDAEMADELKKQAQEDRARNLCVAKLLTAFDVLSEVGR